MNDTDFNATFAFIQSRVPMARRRQLSEASPLPSVARPPPPPSSSDRLGFAPKVPRWLQQSTLQQDLTDTLAAAAGVPSSYVTVTNTPLAGGTAFACTLTFPANATSLAVAFYGLVNMFPGRIFGTGWGWPVPVLSTSIQISGLALTWQTPPSPPIVRLPPPPPPPLSPPAPGSTVDLVLAPGFAVSQWAVDQIACDNSGCTPYDRRIAYEPVGSANTSWGAMKDMPFSLILTASRAISGVSASSLTGSGFQVTGVTELSPGRQFQFDVMPTGTGNFSVYVPAGAVLDLGASGSRRRLMAATAAPASNSLTIYYDSSPVTPTFQYEYVLLGSRMGSHGPLIFLRLQADRVRVHHQPHHLCRKAAARGAREGTGHGQRHQRQHDDAGLRHGHGESVPAADAACYRRYHGYRTRRDHDRLLCESATRVTDPSTACVCTRWEPTRWLCDLPRPLDRCTHREKGSCSWGSRGLMTGISPKCPPQKNTNQEASVTILYQPVSPALKVAGTTMSAALGATVGVSVASSAAGAAAGGAAGGAGGGSSASSSSGAKFPGNLLGIVGFAQVFVTTSEMSASGLSPEYKSVSSSLGWVMLDIHLPFIRGASHNTTNANSTSPKGRRRLLQHIDGATPPEPSGRHQVFVLGPRGSAAFLSVDRLGVPAQMDPRRRQLQGSAATTQPGLQQLQGVSFESDLKSQMYFSHGKVVDSTNQVPGSSSQFSQLHQYASQLQQSMKSKLGASADPYVRVKEVSFIVWLSMLAVTMAQVLLIPLLKCLGKAIPSSVRFPKPQLMLGLFLYPTVVGVAAGCFKYGGRGPILVGVVLLLSLPVPLLLYILYIPARQILLPHSDLRRLFYEVGPLLGHPRAYRNGPRTRGHLCLQVSQKALDARDRLHHSNLFYRFVIFPLFGNGQALNGVWKAHPGDEAVRILPCLGIHVCSRARRNACSFIQGELMLAKYGMLIQGLRGNEVVRRNATYEVDPMTQRINRCAKTDQPAVTSSSEDRHTRVMPGAAMADVAKAYDLQQPPSTHRPRSVQGLPGGR